MRKKLVVLFATGISLLLSAGVALANPHVNTAGDRLYTGTYATDCIKCHEAAPYGTTGPHGGYTAQTNKCQTCHDIHVSEITRYGSGLASEMNEQLLPGATLTAACNYCHDLTGSYDGPYNSTGLTPDKVGAAHRVQDLAISFNFTDSENHLNNNPYADGIIPGGDAGSGVSGAIKTYSNTIDYSNGAQGRLSGSDFTCDSCHTPHGVNTVQAYLGESEVKVQPDGTNEKIFFTTRLLKSHPNQAYNATLDPVAAESPATEYGSKWCMGCHSGRDEIPTMDHNHPVAQYEKDNITQEMKGYYFLEEAGWTPDQVKAARTNGFVTVTGTNDPAAFTLAADPRTNKQYALTEYDESVTPKVARGAANWKPYINYVSKDPVTGASLVNNGPSCQMCHGSARDVEAPFVALTNPQRLSFPHISTNKAFTVETGDDFCTNCHAPSMLP